MVAESDGIAPNYQIGAKYRYPNQKKQFKDNQLKLL